MALENDPLKNEDKKVDLQKLPEAGSGDFKQPDAFAPVSDPLGDEKLQREIPSELIADKVDSVSVSGNSNIVGDKNFLNQGTVNINFTDLESLTKSFTEFVRENLVQAMQPKSPEKHGQSLDGYELPQKSKQRNKPQRASASKKTAENIRKEAGPPHEWFNKLTENQKLYAMLAVLLKGLDREILDNLYIIAVDDLRQEGLSNWLSDARTLGLDDLLDSLMATEDNGVVQLLPDYEAEVKSQIINRYHLLWSIFENLLSKNEKEIAFTDWQFREILGHAIGRVGLRYPIKLENLLDKFAEHTSHRIVVMAGYALAEIARLDLGESKLYERLLDKWVSSKRPNQSWAAAASVWRIYLLNYTDETVKNVLWKHIETLIDDLDDLDTKTKNEILSLSKDQPERQVEKLLFNLFLGKVDVISDALNHMFDAEPEDVVTHLIAWLKSDEQNKQLFISQRAIGEILNRISRREFQSLDAIRWGLKLFPSILDTADEDLIDIAFSALQAWFTSDIFDQEKKQEIARMVVEIIDRANSDQLGVFRKGFVEYCFTSNVESNEALTALSINLLTRTYFVDGYPVIPADLGNLILFADATPQGKALNSLGLISRVHPLINSTVKTYMYLMGYSRLVGSPDKIFQEGNQLVWHDLPRLMASPLVETSNKVAIKPAWLATLSYGPIIDEMDVLTKYPTTNILNLEFYKSKDEDRFVDEVRFTLIDYSSGQVSSSNPWLQVVDDLCSFLIRNITKNNPEELWNVANHYVKCKPTVNQASAQIRTAFKKLQEGNVPGQNEYYVISCLFLWLLKKESASALKVCNDLLGDGKIKEDSVLSLGIYFGKFILRSSLYLDVPIANITNLSLSMLRILPDWTTFELALRNIEKFYEDQSQANAADIIDPSMLVTLLPPTLKSKMILFLNKWINDKKSTSDLKKFSERLKFFIEIGLLSSSPDIEENRKFGLVFVDGDLSDRQYLDYALEFISELEKMPLGENVLPVLYRLGQKVPLAVGYGKHNIPKSGKQFSSPNFLNPILMPYPMHRVLFRAILIKNPVFDFDDKKQDWSTVPTIIFDGKNQSKSLDGVNLLHMSPYDYTSRNITTVPDAIGSELTRMVKVHS